MTPSEKLMLVYAFRYAVPRRTGALNDVMLEIQDHIHEFKTWELQNLSTDIVYEISMRKYQDTDYSDLEEVLKFFTKHLTKVD